MRWCCAGKIATAVGSAIACGSLVAFNATRSSYIATLAYCAPAPPNPFFQTGAFAISLLTTRVLLLFSAGGIVFGNSFDYSGFLPNYIECAGNDPGGVFIAWVNTIAWAGGYVRSPAALRCLVSAALCLRHRPCAAPAPPALGVSIMVALTAALHVCVPAAPQLATEAINRIAVRGGTRNWAIMWMAPAILRALATGVYWGWASVIYTHT